MQPITIKHSYFIASLIFAVGVGILISFIFINTTKFREYNFQAQASSYAVDRQLIPKGKNGENCSHTDYDQYTDKVVGYWIGYWDKKTPPECKNSKTAINVDTTLPISNLGTISDPFFMAGIQVQATTTSINFIQKALSQGGFLSTNAVLGKFDVATIDALKKFQLSRGYPPTGTITLQTLVGLSYITTTSSINSTSMTQMTTDTSLLQR